MHWWSLKRLYIPSVTKDGNGFQTDSYQRGGELGDGWKKNKGVKQQNIYIKHIDTDNSMVVGRGKGDAGRCKKAERGSMGTERYFRRWARDALCRWCFVELYAWNLYGFVNQCHPNKPKSKDGNGLLVGESVSGYNLPAGNNLFIIKNFEYASPQK